MTTIIKVTTRDNKTGYVSRTQPTIETTEREEQALRMDIQTTLAVAMTLGHLGIRHSMITKGDAP